MKTEAQPHRDNTGKEATVKRTISLPANLLERGEGKARQEQRNFSSYIQSLIARDTREEATAGAS